MGQSSPLAFKKLTGVLISILSIGISWYVEVRSGVGDQKGFLGVSLVPHNIEDDHDWSIKTSYDINFDAENAGISGTYGTTFSKEVQQDFKYTSISYLEQLGVIKDDSFSVTVILRADKLIRKSVI